MELQLMADFLRLTKMIDPKPWGMSIEPSLDLDLDRTPYTSDDFADALRCSCINDVRRLTWLKYLCMKRNRPDLSAEINVNFNPEKFVFCEEVDKPDNAVDDDDQDEMASNICRINMATVTFT